MLAISNNASFLVGALGYFDDIPFSTIKVPYLSIYNLSILGR